MKDNLCLEERGSLEILKTALRTPLKDRWYLEESDLPGDLEEGSEDAFERKAVTGRKISLWRS